ncbi:MAG: phage major capsid protein [Luteolibacter sp.]|uniref:phage major capsid protein n=1 Tax=Luteolibacter sp. TaxID=1962973 RepID=UPI003265BFB9
MIIKSPSWLGHPVPTLLLLLLLASGFQPLHAAEPADPSVKLREQLRAVMLQLRTAQTESANAQVAAAAADQKSKDLETTVKNLETKNTKLLKQTADDKAAAEKSTTALQARLTDRDQRILQLNDALAQWKDGYQKAVTLAKATEEQRAKLADQAILDQRAIADLRRKNISLFNTANEILDRYENYSLGKALSAREPFIGTTRVKVENLVQGYKDKILDQRIAAPAAKP